ncbi:MAG: CYTH domain-containing protein [Acidaminococcaceae bacterium]
MDNKTVEMEMKFTIAKKDLKRFLALPIIAEKTIPDSLQVKSLDNYYYDTASYKLSQAGVAYRIRKTGKEYEATIKTQDASQGGFSERQEYTVPLKNLTPTLEGFTELGFGTDLPTFLAEEELQVLFQVTVKREIRLVRISPTTVVELAVDEGNIIVGKQKEKIEEIELELVEGNKGDLFAFMAQLAGELPLFIEARSKFKRGLDLLAGSAAPLAPLTTEVKIVREGNVEGEFKKLLAYQVNLILEAQNALRAEPTLAEADRLLLNKVKGLRAVLNFIEPLLDSKDYKKFAQSSVELIIPLQELYILKRFNRQWNQVYKQSGTLLRSNVMQERLAERQQEILNVLETQITGGLYTHKLLALLAWTENVPWQGASFIQLEQFALCRLEDWHKHLLTFDLRSELLQEDMARDMRRIIEVMVMVRRSLKIGRLNKENFAYLKALYRQLKILNFDVYGHKDILSFLQGTNSRVLYRDAGLLLGWRLAAMPLAWRRVQKSWNRLLQALKKK